MIQKKICMLGSFAVGKTSLVARYIHSVFSEKYLTTIGVKIDRKELVFGDQLVNLMLWDIHGEDEFQKVRSSYLRGMSGYFLVVDPTRPETLDVALSLHELAIESVGEKPCLMLLNKSDIEDQWSLDMEKISQLIDAGWYIRKTSAKLGENVEESFVELARRMLDIDAKA
ncbi:MAG: Rab family GTPase [Planctomycetota bacterium]